MQKINLAFFTVLQLVLKKGTDQLGHLDQTTEQGLEVLVFKFPWVIKILSSDLNDA